MTTTAVPAPPFRKLDTTAPAVRDICLLVDRSDPDRHRLVSVHANYETALEAHAAAVRSRATTAYYALPAGERTPETRTALECSIGTDLAVRSLADPRYAHLVAVFTGDRLSLLDRRHYRRIGNLLGYEAREGGWTYRIGSDRPVVQGWASLLGRLRRNGRLIVLEREGRDTVYLVPVVMAEPVEVTA